MIAVLVPVLKRPHRVEPLVRSFAASCRRDQATLLFIVQQGDEKEREALTNMGAKLDATMPRIGVAVVPNDIRSWAKKINVGFRVTNAPWILCGADDLNFIPGWVEALVPYMGDVGAGVIGTADLGQVANVQKSCHPLVRRSYVLEHGTIDEPGKVVHEGYDHNFPDTELALTALSRGAYRFAPECVIEHLHPLTGKAKIDDTYRLGSLLRIEDEELFASRCRLFKLGSYLKVLE